MHKEKNGQSQVQNWSTAPTSLRVLFVHNSVPEYRIEFWKQLSKKVELELLITNNDLDSEIYGLNRSTDGLKLHYFSTFKDLKQRINDTDVIILPPADSLKEICIGCYILQNTNKMQKTIYWTEKWEAETIWLPRKKKIKNYIQRLIIGNLAKRCDGSVAAGTKSYEYLKKLNIPEKNIGIAYDSSTSPKVSKTIDFEREYHIPPEAKVVLYFGRLVERKGIMVLLEAFQRIQRDDTYLLICGDGAFREECEKYVEVHKMNQVVFAGKVQPEERMNYYMRATVFVLPSYPQKGIIEAWGLTVNEALEAGCPVIATDAVGSSYDLLDGISGIQIKSDDVGELSWAIENIKISKKVYEHCRNMANRYSVEKMVDEFVNMIRKVSNN